MFRKKKYNHKKENLYDACGLNKKKLNKKLTKLKEKLSEQISDEDKYAQSKVIELIENELDKREMAFTIYIYSLQLVNNEYQVDKDYDKSKHPEFM